MDDTKRVRTPKSRGLAFILSQRAVPIALDPVHGKVHKLPLLHKDNGPVAQGRLLYGVCLLKGGPDFSEVLAVYEKGGIAFDMLPL